MEYGAWLCAWYEANKRDMPWRHTSDPYGIWVSEIMLQQTQVDTVIPYYQRFMERFPDMKTLAAAELEEVYACWQGLGYYRRAENLHKGARMMVDQFGGVFPRDRQEAAKVPGIGAYTLGAVFSIAFDEPLPAVDGNVMRVLARQFKMSEDIAETKVRKVFEERIPALMAGQRPSVFNQAMMELGALICTPQSPKCCQCPMKAVCKAYLDGTISRYPVKTRKTKPAEECFKALILMCGESFWMEKRPKEGLLADLWAFPLLDGVAWQRLEISSHRCHALRPVSHVFTHRRWRLEPFVVLLDSVSELERYPVSKDSGRFVSVEDILALPVATAFRKVTGQLGDFSVPRK